MSAKSTVTTGLGERYINASTGLDASHAGEFAEIPIIDLAEEESVVVDKLRDACTRVGFFYLKGHSVPEETIEDGFRAAKQFFKLPLEEKIKLDIHKSESYRGYTKLLGENVDTTNKGDLHEGFDVGSDSVELKDCQWPEGMDDFREKVTKYWEAVRGLGLSLFPLVALSLSLPRDFFTPSLKHPGIMMRLLYYPAQVGEVDEKQLGIGAHTDYELFTLLVQDDVQALQVLNKSGEWIHAKPMKSHFVVNIGDTLQRWTNDVFISTMHRAINRSGIERYSIPTFFGVDYDTLVECLPSCVSESRPPRHEPIKAGVYLKNRLDATYADSAPPAVAAEA